MNNFIIDNTTVKERINYHNLKGKISKLCNKYSVDNLEFFGSILRDDFNEYSDIDILIEFNSDAKIGYSDFYFLQNELSQLFMRQVDLVPRSGLKHKQKRAIYMYNKEKPNQTDIDKLYLLEIINSADAIKKFISGLNKNDFLNDELRQSAVCQKLITIGVSACRIKSNSEKVNWKMTSKYRWAGLKEYFSMDASILWETIENEVPKLKKLAKQELKTLELFA